MTRTKPREHGTLAKARREGCNCAPCNRARRVYEYRRASDAAAGRPRLIDAAPARAHVEQLRAAGMTSFQIEQASGVHRTAVASLLGIAPGRPASKRIRPATAQALMAVQPENAHDPVGMATVDSTGTRRRVEALMALGYPRGDLAARLGLTGGQLQIAKADRVLASSARAVRALYAELENTTGPSSRVRQFARNRGYLEPKWWDEDTIDDPAAEPEGLREYERTGRLLVDDVSLPRAARAHRMAGRGLPPEEIAARIGCPVRYVRRDLARPAPAVPMRLSAAPARSVDDLDQIAIDAVALEGRQLPLTRAERHAAILLMHASGLNDVAIAQRLGMKTSAVQHFRARSAA